MGLLSPWFTEKHNSIPTPGPRNWYEVQEFTATSRLLNCVHLCARCAVVNDSWTRRYSRARDKHKNTVPSNGEQNTGFIFESIKKEIHEVINNCARVGYAELESRDVELSSWAIKFHAMSNYEKNVNNSLSAFRGVSKLRRQVCALAEKVLHPSNGSVLPTL